MLGRWAHIFEDASQTLHYYKEVFCATLSIFFLFFLLGLLSIIMNIYSNVVYEFLQKNRLLPENTSLQYLKNFLWWIALPLLLIPLSFALLSLNTNPEPPVSTTSVPSSTSISVPTASTSLLSTATPIGVSVFDDQFQTDTRKWNIDLVNYRYGLKTEFLIGNDGGQWNIYPDKEVGITIDLTTTLDLSDLEIIADMKLGEGEANNAYGITFRNGGDNKGLYCFFIKRNKYALLRIDDTGTLPEPLKYLTYDISTNENYRLSEYINVDGWNELRIINVDTHIFLFINNHQVFDIINRDLQHGNVGLAATTESPERKAILVRRFQVFKKS